MLETGRSLQLLEQQPSQTDERLMNKVERAGESSAVKDTGCSFTEDPSSWWTAVPEDPTPSSGLCELLHTLSYTHIHKFIYSVMHTNTYTLSLSHTYSLSQTYSLTNSHNLCHKHSHTYSLSLTYTHAYSQTQHTHTH